MNAITLYRPRAIAGMVHAEHDPKAILAQLNGAFEEFKRTHGERQTRIEAALDTILAGGATAELGGSGRILAAPYP